MQPQELQLIEKMTSSSHNDGSHPPLHVYIIKGKHISG